MNPERVFTRADVIPHLKPRKRRMKFNNTLALRVAAGILLLLAYAISIWLGDDTIWRTIAHTLGLP